jgi:hypothetical protein
VPAAPLRHFLAHYLPDFLALFPQAIVVAAGSKAAQRLERVSGSFKRCSALTMPEANKPRARESWRAVGESIQNQLQRRVFSAEA